MKRHEHKVAVQARIISEARKLFLERGYQNTTMRQIAEVADVKTGSLYHFYKNKEDILEKIVMRAFFRVQERTAAYAGGDLQLHLACELAWHVYTMAQHAPSAELYMISYNSPVIAAQLLINQIERSKLIFGDRFPDFSEHDYEVYAMSARGLLQSISLRAVSGTLTKPEAIVRKSSALLLKSMNTPRPEILRILDNLDALQMAEKVTAALN